MRRDPNVKASTSHVPLPSIARPFMKEQEPIRLGDSLKEYVQLPAVMGSTGDWECTVTMVGVLIRTDATNEHYGIESEKGSMRYSWRPLVL
jgi:hypothetical protein